MLFLTLLCLPTGAEPKLRWRWSQPATEILGVCPDSTGTKVAVVRRLHWPDGHEAEGSEKQELANLEERAQKDPRFQDPEVVLLRVSGESKRIDWGWDPDFSPAGDRLCYSHQAKPATGLRILAATLEGNWLEEWTEASGRRVLVRPERGFLASPTYSPDGRRLLYELQAAVNGAWPGTVGAGVYDFSTAQAQTLLTPARHKGLDLLIRPLWVGNQVVALRGTPLRAGTYVSDSYQWQVIDAENRAAVLLNLPPSDLSNAPLLDSSAGLLRIQSRRFDIKTRQWLDPKAQNSSGKWSPDGKWSVVTRQKILILSDASGRESWRTSLPASASGLRWSANARYLAVICTQMRRTRFIQDEVLLFQM